MVVFKNTNGHRYIDVETYKPMYCIETMIVHDFAVILSVNDAYDNDDYLYFMMLRLCKDQIRYVSQV